MLVLHWIIVGFILTLTYKAVLRGLLMNIEYEKPIDTVDDLLESEFNLLVPSDTPLKGFLEADPTQKIRQLYKKHKIKYYIYGRWAPGWVKEG